MTWAYAHGYFVRARTVERERMTRSRGLAREEGESDVRRMERYTHVARRTVLIVALPPLNKRMRN